MMIPSYKKYFLSAVMACSLACQSLHAHQEHNATSMLFLLAHNVDDAPLEGKKKAIIQEVTQYFQEHGEINPELLQKCYLTLGLKPEDLEKDPASIVEKILTELKVIPNVSLNQENDTYHSLGSKGLSSYKNKQNKYFITLSPQDEKSIQNQISELVDELGEETDNFKYVKLTHIIDKNYTIPQHLKVPFFKIIKEYVTIQAEIKKLIKKNKKKKSHKIKKQIKNKKEVKRKIYRKLDSICLKCNFDIADIKYLLNNYEEVHIDHNTGEILTAVDTFHTEHLEVYGNHLLFYINQKKDSEEEDPAAYQPIDNSSKSKTLAINPYANEEIVINNYRTQHKIYNSLVQYLKIITDPETGQEIYTVYYQVYNKKKDRYEYYKYTLGGFKRIREKTFFVQSKSKDVHLLVYEKVDIQPFFIPIPWIDDKVLDKMRNMILGAFIALAIVAVMQLGDSDNVEYVIQGSPRALEIQRREREREQRAKRKKFMTRLDTEGTPTIPNGCYWNSVIQLYRVLYRDYFIQDHDGIKLPENLKNAFKALFDSMDRAMNAKNKKGQGANLEEVHTLRNEIADLKDANGNPAWFRSEGANQTKQEDTQELFIAITRSIEVLNGPGKEAIPSNIKAVTGIKRDFDLTLNDHKLIKKSKSPGTDPSVMIPLALPPNGKDSMTFEDVLHHHTHDENLQKGQETVLGWNEFCEEFKILDANSDVPKLSEALIKYLILDEYDSRKEQLSKLKDGNDKEIDKNAIGQTIIKSWKKILDNKKDGWLGTINSKFYKNNKINKISEHIEDLCSIILVGLAEKLQNNTLNVNEIPKHIVDETIKNNSNDEYTNLLELLVALIVIEAFNQNSILGSKGPIENAIKYYKQIKQKKLDQIDKKELFEPAVKFFTDLGFDQQQIQDKFENRHIRIDGNSLKIVASKTYNSQKLTLKPEASNKIFAFQLKRFSDPKKKDNRKVTDCLKVNFNKFIKIPDSHPNMKIQSELVAVQTHDGKEKFRGHHTTYVKRNNKWTWFNDENVFYSVDNIEKEAIAGKFKNAYLLFYRYKLVRKN